MKIVIQKPQKRIRAVVFFFSAFVALMLFQTSYMNLGTITAAAAILLTIAAFFLQNGTLHTKLLLPFSAMSLLLFLLYSVLRTIIAGTTPSSFVPYISQIVLCIILYSVSLNEREHRYIKTVFMIAAFVYAVLIIKSLYENHREGYYHTEVQIFNTSFDPNFIGIPLVAAMALLLDQLLRGKKKVLSAIAYMVITYAVFYTASRGSFVAALVSNGLVLLLFLLRSKLLLQEKAFYFLLSAAAIALIAILVKEYLPAEWERLTTISADQDNGRWRLWALAIDSWRKNPIFGNGLGYAYAVYRRASHNTYLQVLSETGLVGMALLLGFLWSLAAKAFKSDPVLFCALMGVLVQIAFLDALSVRCLWILLCWIAMLPRKISVQGENDHEKACG